MDNLDLETVFNEAADVVQSKGTSFGLQDHVLLKLYGLYKVSTVGACNESQPGIFNVKGRAKWAAWKESSKISKVDAMKQYVNLVKMTFRWEPSGSGDHCGENTGSMMGNTVSSFVIPCDQDGQEEEDEDNVFAWAKDADLERLTEWAENNHDDINVKDANGLTPLIWSVDRGHLKACQILLDFGADPSLPDDDGVTPLEYAETCEHQEIITLLQQRLS